MKELITRVEELAVQAAGAQLQIDKSEAEARELGRELGKARQKMMELVNERDHALARVPPEAWLEENKKLADRIECMESSEDIIRKSLNEEITKRDRELREMDAEAKAHREALQAKDAEIGKLISLSNERELEITNLKEAHSASSDGLSSLQIENLKRQLQTAKDELERQHLREAKISAEYQADIKKILATANKLGRADYESPESFMNRQAADMESQGRQLNLVRQELGDQTQKVIELSRWHEENLEKIKGLEEDLAQSRSQ